MKSKKVLMTGEAPYLFRHEFLFKAMSKYFNIQILQRKQEWYEGKFTRQLLKYFYATRVFSISKADTLFQKNQREFIVKSQKTEQEIRQMKYIPDVVFHIFNTYSPFWNKFDIPYVLYLDYTMALSEKKQLPWAYFITRKERDAWFECEHQLFERAKHLFVQSCCVKSSLLQDYGMEPQKVTVVGASGNFEKPYEGEKTFGSKQILFNGSDFQRKGGDLVLAAFKKLKQVIPEAKLVIIGKKLFLRDDSIENPGHISHVALQNLFLKTDLVLAPAYCDPFPRFVMEAMNYGIPCIVSANDGMPEIVDNNMNGIVIEKLTAELLANSTINLLNNPSLLASMSQAARKKIKTTLNWSNVAERIVHVLSN
ncbi:hypothetical protein BZZ01_02325 [Nostocales cyanobacterium HT-58-2]|nr:hypothetical protein BZZ01_02325 [Nostocales cyanobacterium HT-58-2]